MSRSPSERRPVQRHHWLNAIVGYLDDAFALTEAEKLTAVAMLSDLLDFLQIPERGEPSARPPMLDAELAGQLYSRRLLTERPSRPSRPVQAGDHVVPAQAWRNTIAAALQTGYPDLGPLDRIAIARTLDPLLEALGVPNRACRFLPHDTVIAARDS